MLRPVSWGSIMEPRHTGEPRPNHHTREHEELAALHALEALAGMERADFERHLDRCLRCREVVRQDQETLGALATILSIAPSPGFRERLMARAAALAAHLHED